MGHVDTITCVLGRWYPKKNSTIGKILRARNPRTRIWRPGDKLVRVKLLRLSIRAAMGARDAPPRVRESDDFGLTDPTNSNRTKLKRFPFRRVRQGRSDQDSLPCSRQLRSPSQTPPSSRSMHKLLRLLGAGSSNRRADQRACR